MVLHQRSAVERSSAGYRDIQGALCRMRWLILAKSGLPASAPSCGSLPHSILMQFSPITSTLSYMTHTAPGGSRRPRRVLFTFIGVGIAVVVMFLASQLQKRTAKTAPPTPSASPA